ncbi:MAG: alpha/beta hydrolase [Pacificimonas sp.]|nr:alpha/beta hydrolase [Pacificimonas sp.]
MTAFSEADVGGGIRLHYAADGAADAPLALLVHGFPEGWYSWRHQLPVLAEAGYRAVAPDVRGYGGSSRPAEVEAYALEALAGDMAALAAQLSPDRPSVVVGHDWGAPIAWTSGLLHPGRFRAVAGLSVPHAAPGNRAPDEVHREMFTEKDRYFYIEDFQNEGVAEAELEADPAAVIRKFYYAISGDAPPGTWPNDKKPGDGLLKGLPEPPMPLPWLDQDDVAHYAAAFARSGFRGPLNRYRNRRRDWDMLRRLESHVITQPSLFISGTKDPATMLGGAKWKERLHALLPDLRGLHMIEGVGHWTQQEAPETVNSYLLAWLDHLGSTAA